jgi:hypothetical protein
MSYDIVFAKALRDISTSVYVRNCRARTTSFTGDRGVSLASYEILVLITASSSVSVEHSLGHVGPLHKDHLLHLWPEFWHSYEKVIHNKFMIKHTDVSCIANYLGTAAS